MDSIVELKNLKKYFSVPQGTLHAVDDISLKIERGKTLGVVGESGCGKSTLGRTIIRLIEPTSGEIYYNGENIVGKNKAELKMLRRDLQMIFQDPYESLDPRMSINQLVSEPLKINKLCSSTKEETEIVEQMLELVGISRKMINNYPHELDGGTRQRVGIARALALNPQLVICDEPVSALDVSIQAQVINLLQKLQADRGLTYVFITHNLSVARHISDTICVMYLGQVIELAEFEELFKHTLHPYSQALLSAIPVPSTHNRRERIILKRELTSPIDPKPGCRFAPRCIHACDKCFEQSPELREAGPGHFVACHRVQD
jgi:oligopeptide/dipeptide ABC transporter ATP-binding protein